MPAVSSILLLLQSIPLNLFGALIIFAPLKVGAPWSEMSSVVLHVTGYELYLHYDFLVLG